MTSITFAAVICDANLLCEHRKGAWIVFHCVTSECKPGLGISEISVPTPLSWDEICPSAKQSRFCPLFVLPESFFFLFALGGCRADGFSSSCHSLSTAYFASRLFIPWGIGINLCTKLWWLLKLLQFPRCDLHDLFVEIRNAFSWIHDLPRCMHAFVFWIMSLQSRWQCPAACLSTSLFSFCMALPPPSVSPTFSSRFYWFPCTLHLPDRWNKCLPDFGRYRALVLE